MSHRLSAVLAGLLSFLLLAACSKVPTRSAAPDQPAPAPVQTATPQVATIRVLSNGDSALDAIISAYYARYPNDRVEKVSFQPTPGRNFTDYIRTKLAEEAVDVVIGFTIADLVKDGLVLPLDPFIQKSNFDLKPLGPTLDNLRIDGKLYDLPYIVQPQVLVINRDVFKKAGVPEPQVGWTWDQFRETARRLTSGEGDTKVWGFTSTFGSNMVSMYVNQVSEPNSLYYLNEAGLKGALQLFSTMIFSDKSMPPEPKRELNSTAPIMMRDDFRRGKSAMSMEFIGNLAFLSMAMSGPNGAKLDVDVAPVPVVPGGKPFSFASPQTFAISAKSKSPEAAWRFLQFAAGPEGAAALARHGTVPVYSTPEVKKAWFDRQPVPGPGTEILFTTPWSFPTRSGMAGFSGLPQEQTIKIAQAGSALINRVLSGDRPFEEAFADFQAEVKKAQEEAKKP